MALAVVNYPALSEKDFLWIQNIRKEHDNLFYDVAAPHFTLVFPTENIDFEVLYRHVNKIAGECKSFDFVIRCATVGDPDFWNHAHVFLIPDEGFSDIVKLHDALYRGPLEPELRLDLPFVPHIGIASDPSPEVCKALVDDLNHRNFEIHGRVETLDLIEFDGESTETIKKIDLD